MNQIKVIAIVLIVAGTLGLAYERITYTEETHDTKIGPVEISIEEKETIDIPKWLGVGAIVAGAAMLAYPLWPKKV